MGLIADQVRMGIAPLTAMVTMVTLLPIASAASPMTDKTAAATPVRTCSTSVRADWPVTVATGTETPASTGCSVEIAFLVDTSPSMDDELSHLQATLDAIVSNLQADGYAVASYTAGIGDGHGDLAQDAIWNSWTTAGHTASQQPLPFGMDGESYRESWGPAVEYYASHWPIAHDPCATKILIPVADEGPYGGCWVDGASDCDQYRWDSGAWIRVDGCGWPWEEAADDRDSVAIDSAKAAAAGTGALVVPMVGGGPPCDGVTALMEEISEHTTGVARYYATSDVDGLVDAIEGMVGDSCGAEVWVDDVDTCSGHVTLDAKASFGDGPYTYDWDWDDDGVYDDTADPPVEHIYSAGHHTSRVRITETDSGCVQTATTSFDIAGAPDCEWTSSAPVCHGTAVDFYGPSGDTYAVGWDFGDGNTSSEQNPSHLYAEPGTYTVSLTVTDQTPCSSTCEAAVTVDPCCVLPTADFTVNPSSGCVPLEAQFSDASTGDVTAWSWDFGDGETSSAQHPKHIYQDAGAYAVELQVSNTCGSDTHTENVSVNPLPSVEAGDPQQVCQGSDPIPLTGAAPDGGTWSGEGVEGDHFNSAGLDVGDYAITYSYSDANGCSNSDTKTVTVSDAPDVSVAPVSGELTCDVTSILLTADVTGGESPFTYHWYNGDALVATHADTAHPSDIYTATVAGNYSVSVLDSNDCSSTSNSVTISANADPPSVTVDDVNVCENELPATISADTDATAPTYNWHTLPSSVADPGDVTSFQTSAPGVYCVEVTDGETGCKNSDCGTLTVDGVPVASAPDVALCEGYTQADLEAAIAGAGGGCTVGSETIIDNLDGTYGVTCSNTCGTDQASGTIDTIPLPLASAPDVTLCQGYTQADLEAEISVAGGGCTVGSKSVIDNGDGTYTLSCSNTCGTHQASGTVTVNPNPTILVEDLEVCALPANLSADVSGCDVVGYTWSGPEGFEGSGPSVDVDAFGKYHVTVTCDTGCSASATATVSQKDLPAVSVADVTIDSEADLPVELLADTQGSACLVTSYQWYSGTSVAGGAVISDAVGSAFNAPALGDYTVQVTCDNGCVDEDNGAVTIGDKALKVTKETSLVVARVGNIIVYTYTATNVGDEPISDLVAYDDKLGFIALNPTSLAPGGQATATRRHRVSSQECPGPIVNKVTVSGSASLGQLVTDSALASVGIDLTPAQNEHQICLPLIVKQVDSPPLSLASPYMPVVLRHQPRPSQGRP